MTAARTFIAAAACALSISVAASQQRAAIVGLDAI